MDDHTTNEPASEIPYGYCHCGCGQKTKIAVESNAHFGYKKGVPLRFVHGHSGKRPVVPAIFKLCECGCGQPAPLATSTAKKHGHIKGEPMRYIRGHYKSKSKYENAQDAFLARLQPGAENDCWEWDGHINDSGYGIINYDHSLYRTHRLSWEIHHGPIPDGMFVCHTCDNRKCNNPAHLWLGTHADNQNDKIAKDRTPKGEAAGPAKLKESTVIEIKQMFREGVSRKDLANQFGVNLATIYDIIAGRTWKHIP